MAACSHTSAREDGMNETNRSEIARLREQIALEYQASHAVFTSFTATARHDFISKREENIGACFEELKQYLPFNEAFGILIQAEQTFYERVSSSGNTS